MTSSVALISRRLCRSLLTNPNKPSSHLSSRLCTSLSSHENSDLDDSTVEPDPSPEADSDPLSSPSPSHSESAQQRAVYDRPLENGLDVGVYKAILVGQVGQTPLQKRLRSGRMVTLLSVGTGGIRNNRRPLDNEEPREYANRCAVQWHRVSIYPERLGEIAMKHAVPGSILYLEGNLETKIFNDTITGLVRRIREIAIRRNGRLVFLGKGDEAQQPTQAELKGVGYY
ncbi:Single-stranded DNA-binding protein [Actinidia chinensis var. chinensis]|uniref:Single-stranded DNA-binding protein n=1 Tax=Actinidia chinensis var. chinensis TaxID=1590841 RepID=A0A2R6QI78_ACTCC|nr:Single-stranded DNA-binding protein [Actinidia chinensis var. chinensis]